MAFILPPGFPRTPGMVPHCVGGFDLRAPAGSPATAQWFPRFVFLISPFLFRILIFHFAISILHLGFGISYFVFCIFIFQFCNFAISNLYSAFCILQFLLRCTRACFFYFCDVSTAAVHAYVLQLYVIYDVCCVGNARQLAARILLKFSTVAAAGNVQNYELCGVIYAPTNTNPSKEHKSNMCCVMEHGEIRCM